MQAVDQCQFYFVLFIFKWQEQFCDFNISRIGCVNSPLGLILVLFESS